MVALKLNPAGQSNDTVYPESRSRRAGRLGWTLEAFPVDAWMSGRIEPAVEVSVRQMKEDGMAASSREPILPGRRVALAFPDSPFLPRPGTVARVEACRRSSRGYRLELTFEPTNAA
jgi:hypothetical protein